MTKSSTNGGDSDGIATVAGGAALVFTGRVTKMCLAFLTHIIMARLLGVGSYGGVVLAAMALSVMGLVAKLGLPVGMERYVPQYEDEREAARGVVKAGLLIGLATSGIAGGALFVAAPVVATTVFDQPDLTPLFRIVAFGLPATTITNIAISTTKGLRNATTHVIVNQILNPLSRTVLVTGFILAGYGAAGAVAGRVATLLIATVVSLYFMYRVLPFSLRGPTQRMHGELLGFSFPLMLSAGMNFLIFNTDTLLVGAFLEAENVGIYNVAFQFRSLGMFFFFPFAFLLPPVLTRLSKTDEWTEARRTYQVVSKWMVFLTLPVFLWMMFFPDVVINLTFGPDYQRGSLALQVLMLPVIVTVLLGANGKALVALGHNRINMYVNGFAALANVTLNVLLIPRFGIVGAAIGTTISFMTRDVLFTIFLYRREGIHSLSSAMVQPFVGTLLVAVPGFFLFVRMVTPSILSVVGAGLVFLFVYAPLMVMLGGLESEDERLVSLLEDRIGVRFDRTRSVIARLQ